MSNGRYKVVRKLSSAYNNWVCPFCQNIFRTRKLLNEHKKECDLNNNKIGQKYIIDENGKRKLAEGYHAWNKGLTKETDERIKKYAKTFSERYNGTEEGKRIFSHPQTEEHKLKMQKLAFERHWGGWHTAKTYDYNGIKLDSTYEVKFAEDLDNNNIKWSRPKPLSWIDANGKEHLYYPDFYIEEFNIYVDTKNDYLINHINPKFGITDLEKIDNVMKQNPGVKILILDKTQLNFNSLLEKL